MNLIAIIFRKLFRKYIVPYASRSHEIFVEIQNERHKTFVIEFTYLGLNCESGIIEFFLFVFISIMKFELYLSIINH